MPDEFISESEVASAAGREPLEIAKFEAMQPRSSGVKILTGGQVQDIGDGMKAIVSIPGWSAMLRESNRPVGALAYTKSPWANRCIQIRMNTISNLPWQIEDAAGVQVEEGELVDLFNESHLPTLLRPAEADLCLYGKAFWLKGKPEGGTQTVALRRLNAGSMSVKTSSQGIEYFEQKLSQGTTVRFDVEEIVYLHEFDPENDLEGVALVRVAESAIETEYNADQYISAFFRNYAMPSIIFTTEADLPLAESKKAEAWWRRLFAGAQNQHKTGFVGKGLKPTIVSFEPDKLALETIRAEARRSICATFAVPPTVANASDPGSYATADEQRQSLYEELIVPRGTWYAEQINEQIVDQIQPGLKFRFKFEDLPTLQEDLTIKAERIAMLVDAGIILPKVAALEMGYAPEEAGVGRQWQLGQIPRISATGQPAPLEAEGAAPAGSAKARDIPAEPSPEALELDQLKKKALKRMKAGKSMDFEFTSGWLLQETVDGVIAGLATAKTEEDLNAVFAEAQKTLPTPPILPASEKEQQGMKPDEVLAMIKTLQQITPVGSALTMTFPGATVEINDPAAIEAAVVGAMKSVKPPVVNVAAPVVHVAAPEVTVAAPEVTITAPVAEKATQENPAPRIRSRQERQSVRRDRHGAVEGTDTESTYVYDDEKE